MGGKPDNQEFDFLSHFRHPACSEKRAGKLRPVGQEWTITNFSKQSWTGTQPLPFADVLSLPAFMLCRQRLVVATETVWCTKHEIFALWPFTNKFAEPCPKGTESHRAWCWKDDANQSGEKSSGVTGEEES